jgi:hypothetical protein
MASAALGHSSVAITEAHYLPESFDAIQKATDRYVALLPWPVTAEAEK